MEGPRSQGSLDGGFPVGLAILPLLLNGSYGEPSQRLSGDGPERCFAAIRAIRVEGDVVAS
jgi:hypothetical protein